MSSVREPRFNVGYACISLRMREQNVYSTRTAQLATVDKIGIGGLMEISLKNINDLYKILEYNESWGCRFFRVTSNLFPHMGNPRLPFSYNVEFARPNLERVGKYAREHGHRLTAHPGQFAQLGSPRPEIVEQTRIDLAIHAQIFAAMGLTPTEHGSVMIIHGGGVFGSKEETLERFGKNYAELPQSTRDYVVLENDEYQYSIYDLLPFCEKHKIPLCIDFFHHWVWSARNCAANGAGASNGAVGTREHLIEYKKVFDLLPRVLAIWRERGIRPKCHLSEQRPNSRDGAHSDCVCEIPADVMRFAAQNSVDIMLEVKLKDECLRAVFAKQFYQTKDRSGRVVNLPLA